MRVYLIDINLDIIAAWNSYFKGINNLEVIYSDFANFMKNYNVDCVVSPGNSVGIMAGGYDRAISEYFGWDLTKRVQDYINKNFNGYQTVGTSFMIDTGKDDIKLIHTPSMIRPSRIDDPNVVYNCTKNTLECAQNNNIESIVIPAFGGACGGVCPDIIAKKMHEAFTININF